MANKILSRPELYDIVTKKIIELGLNPFSSSYRINAIELAHIVCDNLSLEILEFKKTDICAILVKMPEETAIALNARRSLAGRNFDCMHELIHYWFHDQPAYQCIEGVNTSIEWQANEGAAQFLVPYQNFIPNYCAIIDGLSIISIKTIQSKIDARLAMHYGVGERVIEYRRKTLMPEIEQYIKGTPMEKIKIPKGSRKANN